MEDIAESIEDVRGGPRPISILGAAADTAAIGDRAVGKDAATGLECKRESETLRKPPSNEFLASGVLNRVHFS